MNVRISDSDTLEYYIPDIQRKIQSLKEVGFSIAEIIVADGLNLHMYQEGFDMGTVVLKEGMHGRLLGIPCTVRSIFGIYYICVE